MKVYLTLLLLTVVFSPTGAQQMLTLDSCRALALRNNKQLNISKLKQKMATNLQKAARTKYLPKLDVAGGYTYTSKEISLLSDGQISAINSLGSTAVTGMGGQMNNILTGMVQQGIISPETAQQLGGVIGQISPLISQAGDQVGNAITDAFKTDTKNVWTGAAMVRQPVYMGGAIQAANKMADISKQMAANEVDLKTQSTLYDIDQAYWLVVSLRQKESLSRSYRELVGRLSDDVHKMIKQGVATKADGLRVDVKVNEADMQLTQVEDGLALARMMLCQLCGLPMDSQITLADERKDSLTPDLTVETYTHDTTYVNRPEVQILENTIDMSRQATRLVRSEYLPHIAITGGYLVSNPNVFNGFQRNFSGVWSIGVMVQIPVWNWFEGTYKVRASKIATNMASMELTDVKEKINLQVTQSQYKLKEAFKRYKMAKQNMKSAEENLRCATVGFREGVMELSDVMAAQTAWQMALSQKIDAEVAVNISRVNVKKALGILN